MSKIVERISKEEAQLKANNKKQKVWAICRLMLRF